MSKVVHFEIPADDMGRARTFYEKAFGWKFIDWDSPTPYLLAEAGPEDEEGIGGALMARTPEFSHVVNVIGVEDLDASIEAVLAAGGKQVQPRGIIPGVGYFCYCKDSEGNVIGLLQQDANAAP